MEPRHGPMEPRAYRTRRTEHRAQSAAHTAPRTEHRAQSTAHRAPRTEHHAQSREHRAPRTEHCAQSTAHRAPRTEHGAQGKDLPVCLSEFPCKFLLKKLSIWNKKSIGQGDPTRGSRAGGEAGGRTGVRGVRIKKIVFYSPGGQCAAL